MILERIKAATAAKHNSIEKAPMMLPLSEQTITRLHYGEILRSFYGYFSPIESRLNQLEGLPQHLPDFGERRKAHLLLADLQTLGMIHNNVSMCTDLPPLNTISQAFGTLYVLEGSTLGGQYISRVVKKNLNLSDGEGTSFFEGYRKETGTRWKLFQQALVLYSTNLEPPEEAMLIESANKTFEKLEKWLNAAYLESAIV